MFDRSWEDGHRLSASQKKRITATGLFTIAISILVVGLTQPWDLPPGDYAGLIFAIGTLAFGIYLFLAGFSWFRKRQLFRSAPTPTLRSLSMGFTQIEATAEKHEDTVTAPFSGDDVLAYWYEIEQQHGVKQNKWKTIDDGQDGVVFEVTDETDTILIDPQGSELELEGMTSKQFDAGKNLPEPIASVTGNEKAPAKRRYTEFTLEPGDDIYVLGKATTQDNKTVITRDQDTPLFLISETPQDQLILFATIYTIGGFIGGIGVILYAIDQFIRLLM